MRHPVYQRTRLLLPGARAKSPCRGTRGGFSLIEVVIAVGLVAFCLVALTGLLAICIDTSRVSMATTSNTMLFQKVVNQLRANANGYENRQEAGPAPSDIFPLPKLGEPDERTFTVDSLDRFIADGASTSGDATKVVNIKVMTPSQIAVNQMESPVALQSGGIGGKVAFVSVRIKSAQGYKENTDSPLSVPSKFCTEISLLTQ